MKKIAILSVITILCACTSTTNTAKSPTLKFGLLTGDTKKTLDVAANDLTITFKQDTELPYFGFVIDPGHRRPFELQTVMYLPGKPKTIISRGKKVNPEGYEKGIKSKIELFSGRTVIGYKFQEGDPLGDWKLVLLVNGKKWAEINFKVIPENAQ